MRLYVWIDDLGDPFELVDMGLMAVVLLPQPFGLEDVEVPGWTVAEICLN